MKNFMIRWLFALFLATATMFTTSAQVVQIGTGTYTDSNLPINAYFGYSYSQFIYLSSDFGAVGDKRIDAISFQYTKTSTNDADSDDWIIYMKTTSNTTISNWEPIANFTEVFNGSVRFSEHPAGEGWLNIILDTPFEYNPETDGNLIIAVDENTHSYCSDHDDFYATERNGAGIIYYSDNNNPDPYNISSITTKPNYYPNAKFTFNDADACYKPTSLSTIVTGSNTTTINWTPTSGGTSWDITSDTIGFNPELATIESTTDTFYTLNNLESNSFYEVYVREHCATGVSIWEGPLRFKTECSNIEPNYLEEFIGSQIPDCWTNKAGSLTEDIPTGAKGSGKWNFNNYSHPEEATLLMDGLGDVSWLITPVFDVTSATVGVTFDLSATGNGLMGDDTLQFLVTPDGGLSWIPMKTWNEASPISSGGQHFAFQLSPSMPYAANIQFAFKGSEGATQNEIHRLRIDNFKIAPISSENGFLTYAFPESILPVTIDHTNKTIDMEIGANEVATSLTATFTVPEYVVVSIVDGENKIIQESGVTQNDFSNPIIYTLTAENNSSETWTVNVTNASIQTKTDLLDLDFGDRTTTTTIDTENHTVAIEMFFISDLTNLDANYNLSYGATCGLDTIHDYSNPVTVEVLAEDGSTSQNWTITVVLGDVPDGKACSKPLVYGNINDENVTNTLEEEDVWWYSFTLDKKYANVKVNLCGSDFDTRLAIYDDCSDFNGGYGSEIGYDPLGNIGYNSTNCYGGEYTNGSIYASAYTFDTLSAGTYYALIYNGYTSPTSGNIRLEITGDTCVVPSNITEEDLTPNSVTISWLEPLYSTSWDIKVHSAEIKPDTTATADIFDNTGLSTTSQAITGLSPETDYYVYVKGNCGNDWTTKYVFTTPSSCPKPVELIAEDITDNSAQVSWLSYGMPEWFIKVSTYEIDPNNTEGNFITVDTITTNEYSLSSLESNTDYYVYVQTSCGSLWSDAIKFTTECPIEVAPYTENFNEEENLGCWSRFKGLLNDPSTLTSAESWYFSEDFGRISSNTKCATLNIWGTSRKHWLVSPSIDLGDGTTDYSLVFDLALTHFGNTNPASETAEDDKFAVIISTDNGETWTSANTLKLWDNAGSTNVYNNIATTGEKVILDLSSYSGIVKIAFYGESTINGNGDNDLYIDNVQVKELSDENDILSFEHSALTAPATIDTGNHTVTAEVSYTISSLSLAPAIGISDYATMTPQNGDTLNYENPVAYTITSESGIEQIWNITVTTATAPSSENNILSFSFEEEIEPAVFNGTDITCTVAWNTDVTELTPTIEVSNLATVTPGSNEETNFLNPVAYIVTAEDGTTTQTYTVTVVLGPIPQGGNCSAPLVYGNINDPEQTNTIASGEGWWYSFTLDQKYANVKVSTCGSNFNTRLAVYSSCDEFTEDSYGHNIGADPEGAIAYSATGCNTGDFGTGSNYAATYTFDTLAAGTYYVVVYGASSSSEGNTRLEITGTDCPKPFNVDMDINTLSATSAIITWEELFNATEWNIKVSNIAISPVVASGNVHEGVATTPSYELTGLTAETTYYVYLQSNCGGEWTEAYSFTTSSACPVTDITLNATTPSSMDLSWIPYGMTEWYIKVSDTIINPDTATTANANLIVDETITSYNYLIENLTFETKYYVYVKSTSCGSEWATLTHYLGYCDATPYSVDNLGITNVKFGVGEHTVNNTTVAENDNYGNYSAMVGDIPQGLECRVDITYQTGVTYGTKIWIDWNNDLDFNDEGELMANGESAGGNTTTLTLNFMISDTMPLGNYRMRIVGSNWGENGPCYSYNYGAVEDYTISIIEGVTCFPVTNIAVNAVSLSDATLVWDNTEGATSWNVIYGPVGFDPETGGTTQVTSDTTYTITGLAANTEYDAYIQSDCGNGDVSFLNNITFRTACLVVTTLPFMEGFEDNSDSKYCWQQEQVTGTKEWTFGTGNLAGSITASAEGAKHAKFGGISDDGSTTKLISPTINLSTSSTYALSFYYGLEVWYGDLNTLKVYYRTGISEAWVEIENYTENVSSWKKDTLDLPNPSATYQIAFEGIDGYGHSIVIDSVFIQATSPQIDIDLALNQPTGQTNCNYTDTETLTVEVENAGAEVIPSGTVFNFSLTSNGNTVINEDMTIDSDLNSGNTWIGNTSSTLDLSGLLLGETTYNATINNANDIVATNNSIDVVYTKFEQILEFENVEQDTITVSSYPTTINTSVAINPNTVLTNPTTNYLWGDGSTSSSLIVQADGLYTLTVTTEDCSTQGSVYVKKSGQNSTETGINNNSLSIYPNPNRGEFSIKFNNIVDKLIDIEILNAQGQIVKTITNVDPQASKTIDIRESAAGMYFVRIATDNNTVIKKINILK